MSDRRIAAVVCEGQTDIPILRAIIQKLWPEVDDVRTLQPEVDEHGMATAPGGWTQVKAWCEQNAQALDEIFEPDIGDAIDLLVVALDVDVAVDAGIADPPNEVGLYETKRLRKTIRAWLGGGGLPKGLVVSTPVTAIEAWVIAALFPRQRAPERIANGAGWLVEKNRLRPSPSDGKPWKELHLYRTDFAKMVGSKLDKVRKLCAEAERTCAEIERRRDDLESESAR